MKDSPLLVTCRLAKLVGGKSESEDRFSSWALLPGKVINHTPEGLVPGNEPCRISSLRSAAPSRTCFEQRALVLGSLFLFFERNLFLLTSSDLRV